MSSLDIENESEKSFFVASYGWVNNFMRRNSFSLRRKTIAAQQDPERLMVKSLFCILCMLVGFQLNVNTLLQV